MAWSTPPTFTAGVVVTEAQMDIISADLAYLKGTSGTVAINAGMTVSADAVFSGSADGQFHVLGATNANNRITIGYDTTNNYGFINTVTSGVGVRPLYLQPSGGSVFIGDNANAYMTQGFTINQGASDDEILAFKSSDVAHGISSVVETDTYGAIKKAHVTQGGMYLIGASSGINGVNILSMATTEDTGAKGAGSNANMAFWAYKKSGTTIGAHGANANLFALGSGGVGIKFIVDAEGDVYADAGTTGVYTVYDEFDDVQLVRASDFYRQGTGLVQSEFDRFLKYNQDDLERLNLVHFNRETDNRPFMNLNGMIKLHSGAIWQLATRQYASDERFAEMTRRLGVAEAKLASLKG